MEGKLDFEGLASTLLNNIGQLVVTWLPGGRIQGHEYVCGDIRGGPGDSFKVNMNTGKWADFSTDQRGLDLISLYATMENIKNGEAAKRLSEQINFKIQNGLVPVKKEEYRLAPPPSDVAGPSMQHPKWGDPSSSWVYKGANGSILFHVARYDTPDGKEFCPWSWSESHGKWVAKGWPAPRPLYGLELLESRPDSPILLCEGERATDAARKIAGRVYVVLTWPNGAKAFKNADFSPIYGRKLLLWPDNDEPGIQAMREIGQMLLDKCPEIKILDVARQ